MFFLPRFLFSTEHVRINISRVGIVLIPGIMGSRLSWGRNQLSTWDTDDKFAMAAWFRADASDVASALDLSERADILSRAPDLTPEEIERGWGGVASAFYLPLLKQLQSELQAVGTHRCLTFAFGYDWRKPTTNTAGELAQHLLELQKKRNIHRFILITHSMGGLVVRAMVQKRVDVRKLVQGVIHLAQPVDGAVVAYRRFLSGAVTRDGGREVDGMMRWLLGDTPEKVATILGAVPAALELLPTHNYQRAPDDPRWLIVSQPRVGGLTSQDLGGMDGCLPCLYSRRMASVGDSPHRGP